jgi:hypothetical protein
VRHLSAAMPETLSAADLLCHSGSPPDARRTAGDLMQALAAVECMVTVGGPAEVPDVLLHDLVVITLGLSGCHQLEAGPDRTAGGSGLPAAGQSPPLAELDRFLAGALTSRFHLESAPVPAAA